jgi:hypothetical protein
MVGATAAGRSWVWDLREEGLHFGRRLRGAAGQGMLLPKTIELPNS